MEMIELLVGIGSLVVSVVPLVVQTIGYFRSESRYASLQSSLEAASRRLTGLKKKRKGAWNDLLTLLEIGDTIVPHVLARVRRRFAVLATVAVATAGTAAAISIPAGDPESIAAGVIAIAINWGLALPKFIAGRLLTQTEVDFLRSIALLHDRFYRDVVIDVVDKFNRRFDDLLTKEQVQAVGEWETLREEFSGLLGNRSTIK